MTAVTTLTLTDFRSHAMLALDGLPRGFVALVGPNGAGKTNALEALSLLSPGRGLRNARTSDLCRHGTQNWAVHADIDTWAGAVTVGTGADADPRARRRIRLNGADTRAQTDVAAYLSCLWLTPQMDGLFMDAGGERRRFFDRLVFAFDPAHAGRVNRYEQALSERSRILRGDTGTPDPRWLDSLEETLAATAVTIAASRLQTAHRLTEALTDLSALAPAFPRPRLSVNGDAEGALERGQSALGVEESLRAAYARLRGEDAQTGGSRAGTGRTDIMLHYADKGVDAATASTGEQKALLTALILAHALRFKTERGFAPVILFDEVAAHLDATRRGCLFDVLRGINTQVWLTGTDAGVFASDTRVIEL